VHTYNHNAFAYHISPEGHAIDMDGQTPKLFDSNVQSAFARKGARNIFECAIDIYEDTFVYGKSKQHPVTLKAGKVMGFSVAYCDNDSPGEEPKTRDTFMGSVWISPADANRSWEDASIFGKVVLAE